MSFLHQPLFWTWLTAAAISLAAFFSFVHQRWVAPIRRLEAMLRDLAAERTPRSFLLRGDPAFGRLAHYIERIAERQDYLAAQAAQEEFSLQAILRSMVEGVIVVDADHVIQMVNEAFIEQFSLSVNPVRRTVLEAVNAPAIEEMIEETFRSGQPQSREISLPGLTEEQAARTFDVSATPVRRDGTDDVVAVFHEISRLKQLEDVRREFVANVSHELRTPLSIFRGYVETLIDQPEVPQSELRRILEIMRKHSIRLNALVDDLLTLARLESRRIVLKPVAITLQPFLKQIVTDIRNKADGKAIAFVLEVPEGLAPIEADAFRLEQVIYNLLDNSIKYSSAGSQITVRAWIEDGFGKIEVRDQGMGIPAADLPHIFERFYRVDKARSRELGGTGLGLSIVKHIIQLHGGAISAESELGQGTAITVALPLADAETKPHQIEPAPPKLPKPKPEPKAEAKASTAVIPASAIESGSQTGQQIYFREDLFS